MKSTFSRALILVFFPALLFPFLFFDKGYWVLWLNAQRTTSLDTLFIYITELGNGFFIGAIALVLLLFFKWRYFFELLIGFLIQAIPVVTFKQLIFKDAPRPFLFFNKNEAGILDLIIDYPIHSLHSFPSGHTATAFFIFGFLALQVRNKLVSVLFLILAFGVGVSRIYLLQHFFMDVYVGMCMGLIGVFLGRSITLRMPEKRWFSRVLIPL